MLDFCWSEASMSTQKRRVLSGWQKVDFCYKSALQQSKASISKEPQAGENKIMRTMPCRILLQACSQNFSRKLEKGLIWVKKLWMALHIRCIAQTNCRWGDHSSKSTCVWYRGCGEGQNGCPWTKLIDCISKIYPRPGYILLDGTWN